MPDGAPWPRISIVTPSYNQGQFIEETIRSVLLQGYPNLEYIIIDGGSTDNSVEIIKKYEPWLAYWVSEKDRGQSHAINKGWERATGEIIAYINSDDIYTLGAFEKVAMCFSADIKVSTIVGKINGIDAFSHITGISGNPYFPCEKPCDLSLFDPDLWFLPQPASFWSRYALEKAGMYVREDLHYTMDRELFYRTCKVGKVALIDKALASFRNHGQNKSVSQTLSMYKEDAIALKYMDDGKFSNRLIRWRNARWWRARGYYFFSNRSNDRRKVLGYLILAAFYKPAYLTKTNFYKSFVRSLVPSILVRLLRPKVVP
jgi:glycosyltransferase involved in cell wall biosynthesis